jgi:lysophospholipase L1-like esterase
VQRPKRVAVAPKRGLSDQLKVAGAAVVVLIAVWALWPSPYTHVTNLGSHGANIIAFGDSLTAGYGASAGEDYPSRLSGRIGAAVFNAGVSGDTTESAAERVDNDVLAHDPRIVILGLGGNDYLRGVPIGTTEQNLRRMIRKVQGSGAMVVLLGFKFPSFTANYEKMYAAVAKDEGCLLIGDLLHGIENDASLKSDEIHPNAKGYDIMADRVAGPLRKLIKKADASR